MDGISNEEAMSHSVQQLRQALNARVDNSASAVRRILKVHGLQPHRWRKFKLSNDPQFVDK